MCGLFSAPSVSAPPPAAPAPAPAPPPSTLDPAVAASRRQVQLQAQLAQGRAGTIITGSQGVTDAATAPSTTKKTLLGQ